MYDAVIFDCDGVLIDSESIVLELQLDQLARRGLTYDKTVYAARFVGMHAAATQVALKQEARDRLGLEFSDTELEEMRAAIHAEFPNRLTAINGARDSLTAFNGKRAVASNSGVSYLKTNLERTGLADLAFPHVFSIDHVENGKPAPDVYLHAAETIGARPQNCLVIEDSVTGARAGVAAGMTVWGFLGGGHVWPELNNALRQVGVNEFVDDHASLALKLSAL